MHRLWGRSASAKTAVVKPSSDEVLDIVPITDRVIGATRVGRRGRGACHPHPRLCRLLPPGWCRHAATVAPPRRASAAADCHTHADTFVWARVSLPRPLCGRRPLRGGGWDVGRRSSASLLPAVALASAVCAARRSHWSTMECTNITGQPAQQHRGNQRVPRRSLWCWRVPRLQPQVGAAGAAAAMRAVLLFLHTPVASPVHCRGSCALTVTAASPSSVCRRVCRAAFPLTRSRSTTSSTGRCVCAAAVVLSLRCAAPRALLLNCANDAAASRLCVACAL
jgi:hypothetical protein